MENQLISKKMQQNGLIVVTLAIFTDMLVYGLVVPILPGYASSLGVSQTAIGLLFACYAIALFIATPVFGILSDKIGRKGPMLWGLLGLADLPCSMRMPTSSGCSFWHVPCRAFPLQSHGQPVLLCWLTFSHHRNAAG